MLSTDAPNPDTATTATATTTTTAKTTRTGRIRVGKEEPTEADPLAKTFMERFTRGRDYFTGKIGELVDWARSDATLTDKATTAFRNVVGLSFVWFGTVLKFAAFYALAAIVLPGSLVAAAPLLAAFATRYVPIKYAIPLMMLNGFATTFSFAVRAALALVVPIALMTKDDKTVTLEAEEGVEFDVTVAAEDVKVGGETLVADESVKETLRSFTVERPVSEAVNPEIAYAFDQGAELADTLMGRTRDAYRSVSERFASRSAARPTQTA